MVRPQSGAATTVVAASGLRVFIQPLSDQTIHATCSFEMLGDAEESSCAPLRLAPPQTCTASSSIPFNGGRTIFPRHASVAGHGKASLLNNGVTVPLTSGFFLEVKHLVHRLPFIQHGHATLHGVPRDLLLIWVLAHSNLFSRLTLFFLFFLRTLSSFSKITSPHFLPGPTQKGTIAGFVARWSADHARAGGTPNIKRRVFVGPAIL